MITAHSIVYMEAQCQGEVTSVFSLTKDLGGGQMKTRASEHCSETQVLQVGTSYSITSILSFSSNPVCVFQFSM